MMKFYVALIFAFSIIHVPVSMAASDVSKDPCASTLPDTTGNSDLEEIVKQIKLDCASKTLADVKSALKDAKNQQLVNSLSALGNIKDVIPKTTITGEVGSAKFGEWFALGGLKVASTQVGKKLASHLNGKADSAKYLLTFDPDFAKRRILVSASIAELGTMTKNLNDLAKVQGTNQPTGSNGHGLTSSSTIGAIITAFSGVARVFDRDVSYKDFEITNSPQSVIISGLCGDGNKCPSLIIPGASINVIDKKNKFTDAYAELLNSVSEARKASAGLSKKADKDLTILEKTQLAVLNSQISQFETLDKFYHSVPSGRTSTPYSDMAVSAAELYYGDAVGTLLLTVNQNDAHAITDKGFFRNNVVYGYLNSISYILFNADGEIKESDTLFNNDEKKLKIPYVKNNISTE